MLFFEWPRRKCLMKTTFNSHLAATILWNELHLLSSWRWTQIKRMAHPDGRSRRDVTRGWLRWDWGCWLKDIFLEKLFYQRMGCISMISVSILVLISGYTASLRPKSRFDSAYITFNTRSKSKRGHFDKYVISQSRSHCYAAPTRRSR